MVIRQALFAPNQFSMLTATIIEKADSDQVKQDSRSVLKTYCP